MKLQSVKYLVLLSREIYSTAIDVVKTYYQILLMTINIYLQVLQTIFIQC